MAKLVFQMSVAAAVALVVLAVVVGTDPGWLAASWTVTVLLLAVSGGVLAVRRLRRPRSARR